MEYIKSALSHTFNLNPGMVYGYYTSTILLAVGLIIFGAAFSHYYKLRKKHDFAFKKLFKNVSAKAYLIGALLLAEVAVRYETIPYLSMRIWLYLTLAYLLYLVYKYVQVYRLEYPKEKANYKSKMANPKSKEKVYVTSKKKR